jgi:hypothetical protein
MIVIFVNVISDILSTLNYFIDFGISGPFSSISFFKLINYSNNYLSNYELNNSKNKYNFNNL